MFTFIKKDILVMIRDRQELKVLLLMPFILTLILGFALSGLMGGEESSFTIDVALVMEDDPNGAIEAFEAQLDEQSIPNEMKNDILQVAHAIQPVDILEQFLNSEELSDMLHVTYKSQTEAESALNKEELAAFLTVPAGYTTDFLQNVILNQSSASELIVTTGSHSGLIGDIFEDMIDTFVRSFNFETALTKVAGDDIVNDIVTDTIGKVETVTDADPISSTTYYAIGMAVMFALFVASTMGSKSYVENYQNVFNRILLSGKSPMLYLSGKGVTTFLLVILQALILFISASLILRAFDITDPSFWLGTLIIMGLFALSIAAVTMVIIAFTMRYNNESISNIFGLGFVAILAMVGGSFTPTANLPDFVTQIGEWTPNGIALSALLQWYQGLSLEFIAPMLGRLLIISVICIVVSYLIFPKRGAR